MKTDVLIRYTARCAVCYRLAKASERVADLPGAMTHVWKRKDESWAGPDAHLIPEEFND